VPFAALDALEELGRLVLSQPELEEDPWEKGY
jgi:hypothetical protein